MSNATEKVRAELERRDAAVEEASGRPTVVDLIRRQQPAFQTLLRNSGEAERFVRVALTEVRRSPELMACTAESLLGALMLSARYRLEPGPAQHVYMIPRYNGRIKAKEVQWMLGYLGMVELARRGGIAVLTEVVCEHDAWQFTRYPTHDDFEHAIPATERGDPIGAYAVARFTDNRTPIVEYLTWERVLDARSRSDAWSSRGERSPWGTDLAAMARKTACRRLFKWLGGDIEYAAVDADGRTAYVEPGSEEVQISAAADHDALGAGDPQPVDEPVEEEPDSG